MLYLKPYEASTSPAPSPMLAATLSAHVVVRPAEPEPHALARDAAARSRRARRGRRCDDARHEVAVEDVEALRAVLGDDAGATDVVDDVVLHEPVVRVVDRDAPFLGRRGGAVLVDRRCRPGGTGTAGSTVGNGPIRWCRCRRVAADVIGRGVEVVERRPTEVLERDVADVDGRAVRARARGPGCRCGSRSGSRRCA